MWGREYFREEASEHIVRFVVLASKQHGHSIFAKGTFDLATGKGRYAEVTERAALSASPSCMGCGFKRRPMGRLERQVSWWTLLLAPC